MLNEQGRSKSNLSISSVLLSIVLLINCSMSLAAPKIVFLSPDQSGSSFWGTFVKIMQAAANDLGVELEIVYSKSNGYRLKRDGMRLLNTTNLETKPDFFITGYWKGVTPALIEAANEKNIKFFLVNSSVPVKYRAKVGRPRGKYTNWLGGIAPDDLDSGYQLMDMLIQHSKADKNTDTVLSVSGINGDIDSYVAEFREQGVIRRIKQSNKVKYLGSMASLWTPVSAEASAEKLIQRNPEIDIFWAASDGIAIGVLSAIKNNGRKSGKDIWVAGMDWTKQGLDSVKSGELVGSWGGHIMEGAWAMVLLYDYYHGVDFIDSLGTNIRTPMSAVTRKNVDKYLQFFSQEQWLKVDFRQFSKHVNTDMQKYRFSVDILLDQIERGAAKK